MKSSDVRERGNLFINGIEIEYFINPISQIKHYFEKEFPDKANTAHMFANCIILYEKGSDLQGIIALANSYLEKPLPEFTPYDLYSTRYVLDDYKKDLLDSLDEQNKVAFELIAATVLKELIIYFGKFKGFYPAKPKRLLFQLNKIDKNFSEKIKTYLESSGSIQIRFNLLKEVITYFESLLGGPRPNAYSFRSGLSF